MAYTARKGTDAFQYAVAKALKDVRGELATQGSYYHADVTALTTGDFTDPTATALTVSSPDATNIGTAKTLANELKTKFNLHLLDDVAHKVADTDNTVTSDKAVDEDTLEDLLNEIKTKYNLHIADTDFHYTADTDNDVSTADATDLTTAEALANALKTAFNAHIVGAPLGHGVALSAD